MAKRTSPKENRDWWSTTEIAEHFGTSPRTVLDWSRDPELIRMGAVRHNGRYLRLHWRKVDEWLMRRTLEHAGIQPMDAWQPGRRGRPPKFAQAMRREAG